MRTTTPDVLRDPAVLLGRLAAALVADSGLPGALALLVDGLGLRSAVLRAPGGPGPGELLAVAGDVVHAVPAARVPDLRTAGSSVELPVPAAAGGAPGTLVVVGARPSHLPLLRAAAAVLGLALLPPGGPERAATLLEGAEQDLDERADVLHDGAVQSLVAARWAADVALRSGDPQDAARVREGVQEAVVALRRSLWHLRPRGAEDLPEALRLLSGRLLEAGLFPVEADVHRPTAGALAPAARVLAYRLVQAVAGPDVVRVGLRPAPPGAPALLDVRTASPLPHPERWRSRLRALGGDLSGGAGCLRLVLPLRADLDPHDPRARSSRSAPDPKACS